MSERVTGERATEPEAGESSPEEDDHLERSTKKVKAMVVDADDSCRTGVRSFQQTLVWGRGDAASVEALGNIDKIAFDMDEDWCEGVDMDSSAMDDSIPTVMIDKERSKVIRKPWVSTLIVKLLGKTLSFPAFESRVLRLWNPRGEVSMIDLGLGYYVAKFAEKDDCIKALTEGPWKILDHYLTVQRWKPWFRPSQATVGSTAVWVRLPELPIECFHEQILLEIGQKIGKPLKIDANTSLAARGKFARICVEVDLTKPLVSRVRVGHFIQHVEYEAMHTVCFDCGIFSHRAEYCPLKVVEAPPVAGAFSPETEEFGSEGKLNNESYGPWMLVQPKFRKGPNLREKQGANNPGDRSKKRFGVLAEKSQNMQEVQPTLAVRDKGEGAKKKEAVLNSDGASDTCGKENIMDTGRVGPIVNSGETQPNLGRNGLKQGKAQAESEKKVVTKIQPKKTVNMKMGSSGTKPDSRREGKAANRLGKGESSTLNLKHRMAAPEHQLLAGSSKREESTSLVVVHRAPGGS